MPALILIRGGGDLASGVALRLHRAGLNVAITELPQPFAVRRTVSFAEAIYEKEISVEGITARVVNDPADTLKILNVLSKQQIPVLNDPNCVAAKTLSPLAIVDGRMMKHPPEALSHRALLYLGLGPGFTAPLHCHAVIETQRGHTLGRVIWEGSTLNDTSAPEGDPRRVLRAPIGGIITNHKDIGDHVEEGDLVAEIQSETGNQKSKIVSPFKGIVRGLIHSGLTVTGGMKIGDIDPRDDVRLCQL
ncbi:MAG TPA: selenium-dependent molybdenum cofactor biosynthesis protein YqeB, partial [Anaerolineales bacterium]